MTLQAYRDCGYPVRKSALTLFNAEPLQTQTQPFYNSSSLGHRFSLFACSRQPDCRWKTATWRENEYANVAVGDDIDWAEMDADLCSWYPGHIAKTEKELKEQLRLMDVMIKVRDARIPLSTTRPQIGMLGQCISQGREQNLSSRTGGLEWGL